MLWNLILYDANKTQYLIDLYNNQSDEVKGKFIDIFNLEYRVNYNKAKDAYYIVFKN